MSRPKLQPRFRLVRIFACVSGVCLSIVCVCARACVFVCVSVCITTNIAATGSINQPRDRMFPKMWCITSRRGLCSSANNGKQLELVVGIPPLDDGDHFFLPMEHDLMQIENLFVCEKTKQKHKHRSVHFIRGGVGVGKSTIALHLAKRRSDFVFIGKPKEVPTFEQWKEYICTACTQEKLKDESGEWNSTQPTNNLQEAIEWFKNEQKILIFDEAHLTFGCADLISTLYKDPPIDILLFSTAAEVSVDGTAFTTPPEITNKYLWRPTVPELTGEIIENLQSARAHLDADSLAFIFELCGGHFGITIHALRWIREVQLKSNTNDTWGYAKTMKEVRASIDLGWQNRDSFLAHLSKSRAVKVNGGGELTNAPKEFVKILFTGPGRIDYNAVLAKELTIKGMLLPTSTNMSGLIRFDWNVSGSTFAVSHPLMCAYYQDEFTRLHWKPFIKDGHRVPESCIDLLARVVARLSLVDVVCAPVELDTESTMSTKDFPHEAQFQHAILKHLWKLDFQTLTLVSNDKKLGQPDIIVKRDGETFIVEVLLAAKTDGIHERHLLRFLEKANYSRPVDAKRCILTIGRNAEVVKERLQVLLFSKKKHRELDDVELLGLVPTTAFCSYTLLKVNTHEQHKAFTIPVDGVSRAICGSTMMSAVDVIKLFPQNILSEMVVNPTWH